MAQIRKVGEKWAFIVEVGRDPVTVTGNGFKEVGSNINAKL
jgi:hypothetical protein